MTKSQSKYQPQRTCIACRLVKEKKALIRIVSTGKGVAEIDTFGKKPGRGAYLCSNRVCWELALKKNHLEYALRAKLNEGSRQTLVEYSHNLLEES